MSSSKKPPAVSVSSLLSSDNPDFSGGFQLVRPVCCGIDVHKKQIVAAIAFTNPVTFVAKYQLRSFPTTNVSIESLASWLHKSNCSDVCMESTGKYWIPVFNILEKEGIHVILTHPKYVKSIKGKKTDKKDARWIANLFRFDLVKNSFIPPSQIRALRELSRYRWKLNYNLHSEKNRYQDCMTMSNLRLDCVFSDPFGKSASSIMDYLISSDSFDEHYCLSLVHPRCKASHLEILDSIRGYHIHPEQFRKITECKKHMTELESHISQVDSLMNTLALPYAEQIQRISDIPGFSKKSALMVISEIGTDMSVFDTSKHISSWAGLAPANNESADKKKSTHCGKGGQYLKPLLIQCALAAVMSHKEPYFSYKYHALRKRKSHKKAIVAIARMLLVNIYFMLLRNEPFKPVDYDKVINRKNASKNKIKKETALQYLREHGISEEQLSEIEKSLSA